MRGVSKSGAGRWFPRHHQDGACASRQCVYRAIVQTILCAHTMRPVYTLIFLCAGAFFPFSVGSVARNYADRSRRRPRRIAARPDEIAPHPCDQHSVLRFHCVELHLLRLLSSSLSLILHGARARFAQAPLTRLVQRALCAHRALPSGGVFLCRFSVHRMLIIALCVATLYHGR